MRVAVIGAGPAGAVAARELARGGAHVVLYERSAWPRTKACGDGLTPASVATLRELGIALPPTLELTHTRIGTARGSFVAPWPAGVPGGTAMPRRDFDATLVRAALDAGIVFEPRSDVVACADARVRVRRAGGSVAARSFDAVVLAEGGTGALAASCGLPPYRLRLVAYRGYARARHAMAPEYGVHYARGLAPGYAWIFPIASDLANVGAVLVDRGNVRARLRDWLERSAIARDAFGSGASLEDGRGGIIPIGRARRYAHRVFAVGDAAGVADPLSAEGVSQAMATGRLVARAIVESRGDVARAGARYEGDVAVFDCNNRQALRMRTLFAFFAEPMIAIAARRPRFAQHVVASGYFQKADAAWFFATIGALG
ncbi:MAG: NAD(P)/FAD-dependent oxidoreductase [Vulcanimicrobiaceae bacterium]